mgnify:CR=1 FL=1
MELFSCTSNESSLWFMSTGGDCLKFNWFASGMHLLLRLAENAIVEIASNLLK